MMTYTILFVSAASDCREERIPNLWILTGFTLGFFLYLTGITHMELKNMFLGALLPLLVCILLFLGRALGGGDIKLLMLLGWLYGPVEIWDIFCISIIQGAGYSLVHLWNHHQLFSALREAFLYLRMTLLEKKVNAYEGHLKAERRVHFAVIILIAFFTNHCINIWQSGFGI